MRFSIETVLLVLVCLLFSSCGMSAAERSAAEKRRDDLIALVQHADYFVLVGTLDAPPRPIKIPAEIKQIREAFTQNRLEVSSNSRRRLMTGSIKAIEGSKEEIIEYWEGSIVTYDGSVFQLKVDPFLKIYPEGFGPGPDEQ